MSRILRLFLAIGVVVSTLPACLAQVEQGAITGVAADQTGASIPAAKVTATNTATKAVATTETNDEGYYKIPYLLPGTYTVVAEKQGFAPQRVNEVTVMVGQIATINFTLKPGTVKDEVTVVASPVMLDAVSSSLGYVVSVQQILELPANRNPYSLLTLSPGVIATGNAATGPIINGGRSNTTAVLFDGQETRNNSTLDNGYTPPMETVAEVRFITNSFSAEFGRSQGGVVTAAGKTGTNELRGSVYEYFRNDKLNANGWNNNRNRLKLNPLRHNEYGFSVGGPVYLPKIHDGRNKTFFFFNWEQMRDHSPNNYTGNVPTPEQRAGDFSKTFTSSGALIRVYDPDTTRLDPNSPNNYIRDPFPNNQIPVARIKPFAQKILSYYPDATLPGVINNYAAPVTRTDMWNKYFTRADHSFADRNRLFFRFGMQIQPISNPFVNVAFPGEGTNGENGNMKTTSWTAVLSDTHTFTPSFIGEFRLGYSRWKRVQDPRSLGFDIRTIGLPQYLKNVSADAIFPLIDVADMTSLGPLRASHNVDAESTPEPQAHFTWIKGGHSVKTGLDMLLCQFNTFRPDYPSGNFSFQRGYTQGPNPALATSTGGYGVASLLLGAPQSGSFTVGPSLALLQKSYNWYLQDDWKVTRSLTLNLGLRWEYQTPWTERYNHLAYFDPAVPDPVTGRSGVLVPTTASHRYPTNPQKRNWAPRVGLAWTFAKDTVFRVGYGWFYAPGSGGIGSSPGDLGSGSQTSTPVYTGPTVAAPNTPPAGASFTDPFVTGLLPFPNTMSGVGLTAMMPNWKTPLNQMWNANIQRTVLGNLLVEAAYIGSRGEHIWSNVNINAAPSQFLSMGSQLLTLVPNPFYGKITSGSLSAATVRQNQLLLPYPHYTNINWLRGSIGDSVYHGFTLRVERRFSKGLLFQSSYTTAKLIDNVAERFLGGATLIDPNNLRRSRSISAADVSQRWVTNFVYELPVGHGKRWLGSGIASKIVGNWQATGIFVMQTGTPIAIVPACATQLPGVSCYADRLKDGNLPSGQRTLDKWFDTSAWVSPAQYSMGTGSRTEPNLRNPGAITFDSVLSRWQPIRERMRLQFRAEMYNIMNHPNAGAPNASITSSTFGQITSKSGSRTITLALRLEF